LTSQKRNDYFSSNQISRALRQILLNCFYGLQIASLYNTCLNISGGNESGGRKRE